MKRPNGIATYRLREKASVFLAELHPVSDAAAREALLASARKTHHDATHRCTAWREGAPVSAEGCNDDGEPPGTAGQPMLKVLEGHGITDALVICARWYGGTKLGKGGLARAYADAALGAVGEAEAQGLFDDIRIMAHGTIEAMQELAHMPFSLLASFQDAEITGREFDGAWAKIHFSLPVEDCAAFDSAWAEKSRGGKVIWG